MKVILTEACFIGFRCPIIDYRSITCIICFIVKPLCSVFKFNLTQTATAGNNCEIKFTTKEVKVIFIYKPHTSNQYKFPFFVREQSAACIRQSKCVLFNIVNRGSVWNDFNVVTWYITIISSSWIDVVIMATVSCFFKT